MQLSSLERALLGIPSLGRASAPTYLPENPAKTKRRKAARARNRIARRSRRINRRK